LQLFFARCHKLRNIDFKNVKVAEIPQIAATFASTFLPHLSDVLNNNVITKWSVGIIRYNVLVLFYNQTYKPVLCTYKIVFWWFIFFSIFFTQRYVRVNRCLESVFHIYVHSWNWCLNFLEIEICASEKCYNMHIWIMLQINNLVISLYNIHILWCDGLTSIRFLKKSFGSPPPLSPPPYTRCRLEEES